MKISGTAKYEKGEVRIAFHIIHITLSPRPKNQQIIEYNLIFSRVHIKIQMVTDVANKIYTR